MKLRYLAVGVLVSTSGFAAANASEAVEQANKQVFLCQYKAAARLDDGVSDVRSIVPAVVIACQRETAYFAEVIGGESGASPNDPRLRAAVEARNQQFATQTVLMQRAEARKK